MHLKVRLNCMPSDLPQASLLRSHVVFLCSCTTLHLKPGRLEDTESCLEQMVVGCLLQAGNETLVVTHFGQYVPPVLDQGTLPACNTTDLADVCIQISLQQ